MDGSGVENFQFANFESANFKLAEFQLANYTKNVCDKANFQLS